MFDKYTSVTLTYCYTNVYFVIKKWSLYDIDIIRYRHGSIFGQ